MDSMCKLCNNASESINHVLFQCHPAQDMLQSIAFPPDLATPRSLLENFQILIKMMDETSTPEKCRTAIPWILWSIWKNQNSILYAADQISTVTLVQEAFEEAEIWRSLNKETSSTAPTSASLRVTSSWQRPRHGSIKCNVSANWRNAGHMIGVAWLSRDHEGNVKHHAREAFTPAHNRIVAELRCMIWALQSMRDLGYRNVVVGLDLQSAFIAITNPSSWPRYLHLLSKITELCSGFSSITFEQEAASTNSIVKAISRSVTQDGRF